MGKYEKVILLKAKYAQAPLASSVRHSRNALVSIRSSFGLYRSLDGECTSQLRNYAAPCSVLRVSDSSIVRALRTKI